MFCLVDSVGGVGNGRRRPAGDEGEVGELIVKLTREGSAAGSTERAGAAAIVAETGASLDPLYGGTTDPELSTWFVARVPRAHCDDVVARLMATHGVDGAYVKPAGEPPERSNDRA